MGDMDAERDRAHAGPGEPLLPLCARENSVRYRSVPDGDQAAVQSAEDRLASEEKGGRGLWLVGGKYSIADLACFSWVEWHRWAGVELDAFPGIQKWKGAIEKRPATETGLNVPDKFELREAMKTKEGEEEYAKHHSNWVMQGQKADQEKHR